MKKLTTILTFALLAIMSFSLTSCDEDQQIALELDGTWRGTVDTDREVFYVDIRFYQSGFSRHGHGYEFDEPIHGYGHGVYSEFNWSVENGNVYLDYDDGSHVVIAEYDLVTRYGQKSLIGRLQQVRNGWTMGYINLLKLTDNRYDNGYDYYVKQKKQLIDDSETDSIKQVVRF